MYKQISEETATRCAFALKHETVKDCRCAEIPALEKQVEELVEDRDNWKRCYEILTERYQSLVGEYEALAGKE